MATIRTKIARTIRAMAPADITVPSSYLVVVTDRPLISHERRGAPDLDHLHARAGLVGLVVHVRPRTPDLAVDADAADALVVLDSLEHRRALAGERGAAGERRQEEAERHDLPDAEHDGEDQPQEPVLHMRDRTWAVSPARRLRARRSAARSPATTRTSSPCRSSSARARRACAPACTACPRRSG